MLPRPNTQGRWHSSWTLVSKEERIPYVAKADDDRLTARLQDRLGWSNEKLVHLELPAAQKSQA